MSHGCPHCHYLDTGDETLVEPLTCPQCGRSIVVDQSLTPVGSNAENAIKQSFGKFRMIETVGEGAFGVVWKGEDVELGRIVAVKLLHSSLLARKTDAERFYREARAAAQLRHPGIVAVHEVSEIDGIPAIISEFVEGATLRQVISERRLDFRESASLVAQVADALDYAHSLKVIHRDVKPGNIMVALPANDSSNDRNGTPEQASSDPKPASASLSSVSTAPAARLLDFGLALRAEAEATMTTDGQVLGTPSYMSPEQALGDNHRVDRRSDVYSLGVVLYEMLTGEVPFKGPSMVVLRKVIGDEPQRPRELKPVLPRDLETICLKAMSKAREARYRTAGEFADDLRRFLVGDPIAARPIGALGKAWRFCRRNPSVAASILAISGILLISSIVSTWFAITAMEARREVERALIDSYISSGIQTADLGRSAESLVWFAAAHDRIKDDPQSRHENAARFWSYARSLPQPKRAIAGIKNAKSMTVHPTGHFAIVRSADGMLSLLDFDREQTQRFPHGESVCAAADWNLKGDWLAVGSEAGCAIFDFPSGEPRIQIPDLTTVTALKFDPSGRFLAVADHDALKIWDCHEQRFSRLPFELRSNGVELHFSQNGKFLAAVCDYDYCRVWSLESEDRIELVYSPVEVPGHEFALFHSTQKQPQFVGNDRYLIVCPDRYRLVLMDTTTWLPARTITFPFEQSQIIEWFCVNPDRSLIAACGFNEVRMFDVESGALVGKPMIHANRATPGSFSADGKTLVTSCGDRTCRFWSVPSGLSRAVPLFHQDSVCLAKFIPDDCSFVTIQEDGLVRVWSDQPLFRELPKGGTDSMVVMSPDGKYCIDAGVNILRALRTPQLHHLASFDSMTSRSLNIDQSQLLNAAFSPDSRQVALLTTDPPSPGEQLPDRASDEIDGGWVRLFDVNNGQQPSALAAPTEPIGAAFSSDGQWLVVVCAGGQVLIIDAAQWEVKHQLFSETGFNGSFGLRDFVRFFPDNSRFITWGIGSKARVWDAMSGKLEYVIDAQDKWFSDIQFSHCGKLFAAASFNKTATVFDAFKGEPVGRPLVHPDWVATVRFSPDDLHLLTACRDGKGRLFNWRTGELTCSTLNHDDELFDVCFADAGKLILTACRDGSARVWSATNGRPISPPLRTAGYCYRAKVTPDNSLIVLASQSDKLQVYSLLRLVEPEPASESGLMSTAEIISGSRLDANGGMENLTSNEWLELWRDEHCRDTAN